MAESADERELREKIFALADKRFGGHDAPRVKKLFLSFDANHDGKLNWNELVDLLEEAGVGNWFTRTTSGGWADSIFDALDKNPIDQKISWEEYLAGTNLGKASGPSTTTTPTSTSACDWELATCLPASESADQGVPTAAWLLPLGLSVGMVWWLTR